ncbi:ParB/RepB/Spo0J family partition protein [Oscillatoria sp. CS-180]|uniref:ParB/RepB/Spo0J family partition protein n=1 Tax=Oscillatoria sp. CS-180 TaxID=3021720 RepID=UPI00232DFD9F|nr:ParB/RepB/Spo0J family partition protein [Oscillatoria sp. CS-180]MDB9529071.1 ParB/RepB/Spo0J family partition protein [Oscillatoria sp. CS-180]
MSQDVIQKTNQNQNVKQSVSSHSQSHDEIPNAENNAATIALRSGKERGVQEIEIDRIIEEPWLPRKCKPYQQLEELTRSVKDKGIIVPILLRPIAADTASDIYELVAGSRRLTAARRIGLNTVPAVIRPLSDQEALYHALIENNLRQDFSAIEQTEATIALLQKVLNMPEPDIIKLFQRVAHSQDVLQNNDIQQQWEAVLGVFSALGKNWNSFRSNDLPMLRWPEEVKQSVRMQKIAPSKARIIARIDNSETRQAILQHAVDKAATISTIKTMRQEAEGHQRELNTKELKARVESTWSNLNKSAVWDSPHKKEKLASLLKQINRLMQETDPIETSVAHLPEAGNHK